MTFAALSAKSALAIVAHPDDEALGCGGALHKLNGMGYSCFVAIFAPGQTRRNSQAPIDINKQIKASSEAIGFTRVDCQEFEDGTLAQFPYPLGQAISDAIGTIRPSIVFTHHPNDIHPDHRAIAMAAMAATRPGYCNPELRKIYGCEVISATEYGYGTGVPFVPNTYMEISFSSVSAKIQATLSYTAETDLFLQHPRSSDSIHAKAKSRGFESAVEFAEAFQLLRGFYPA